YNRYNPTFVFNDALTGLGTQFPVKWNTIAGTGGIGWDLRINEELVFRPILNVSLGHLESDLSIAGRVLENETSREIRFLQQGRLNLGGAGASFMLDYEHYRPEGEIDAELRYTDIHLKSVSNTSEAVEGHAVSRSLGLWSRYR